MSVMGIPFLFLRCDVAPVANLRSEGVFSAYILKVDKNAVILSVNEPILK